MLYRIHLEMFLLYWSMRWEVMLLKEGGNVSVMSAPVLWGYLLYCNMHREKSVILEHKLVGYVIGGGG